ncbi:hypothetical protein AAZX31_17G180200 [Glycine max]
MVEAGELYSKKLAKFVGKRLKSEWAASIWTSTLQRTILTATPIIGFPKIQWRALDEINAGVCDGMAYAEIKKNMPEEYEYVCRLVIFLLFASCMQLIWQIKRSTMWNFSLINFYDT